MIAVNWKRLAMAGTTATLVAVVSACTTAPPPPAPPPVVRIPQRPYPPMGAASNLVTPQALADGRRMTVNYGLSPEQATWNLRSAINVAALNCLKPQHAAILTDYGSFLKTHKSPLAAANKALDATFKDKFGKNYIRERESFQTQVYNYFALPPVIPSLCDAALVVGQDLRTVAPSQLQAYAPTGLARLEQAYIEFFDKYDRYKADLSAWEAKYGMAYSTTSASTYTAQGSAQ